MAQVIDFIFPKILVRISGDSISKICYDEITYLKTVELIEKIKKAEYNLSTLKNVFSEQLFIVIKDTNDDHNKRILINFKRDVYNGRKIKEQTLQQILKLLPKDLFDNYLAINSLTSAIETHNTDLRSEYHFQLQQDEKTIVHYCNNDKFLSGLLLANREMFQGASTIASKKSLKIGLWKYITRMTAKTSPFSTFTSIGLADLKEHDQILSIPKLNSTYSKIRYNNYLLYLILSICRKNLKIRRELPIKLNPTFSINNGWIEFMTNFENVESFQKIKNNAIIEFIVDAVNEKPITYNDLLKYLIEKIDNTENELDQYVYELFQTGLIEFDYGISGLEQDWDIHLISFVKKYFHKNSTSKYIIAALTKLIELRAEYVKAQASTRWELLNTIENIFKSIIFLVHQYADLPFREREHILTDGSLFTINGHNPTLKKTVGREKTYKFFKKNNSETATTQIFINYDNTYVNILKKNMIYEDSGMDIDIIIDEKAYTEFIFKLNKIINVFAGYCSFNIEKSKMLNFYNSNQFNPTIDVLSFYSAYYKAKLTAEKNTESSDYKNIFSDDVYMNELSSYNATTYEHFLAKCQNGDLISTKNEIKFLENALPQDKNLFSNHVNRNASYGSFIQFYLDKHEEKSILMGVVNAVFPGYGKYMSRFLHLFSDINTLNIKEWNNGMLKHYKYVAECSDASFYNANLHPSLTDYEVLIPNSHNRLDRSKRIPVNNIYVNKAKTENELELFYDGQRICILDLGFQALSSRSNLYKLLCSFDNNFYFYFIGINKAISNIYYISIDVPNIPRKIFVFPRIVYEGQIVIQRKRWNIPVQLFEKFKKSKDEYELYLFIQKLRSNLDIPEEVFFIMSEAQKVENDLRKPQYLNLLSPMSLMLFAKNLKSAIDYIEFEEMLPSSKQALKVDGIPYVTEMLAQWKSDI